MKRVPPERQTVQQPGGERQVERHPAYAFIRAARVSGRGVLFGSDFEHQHYVTVTLGRSEVHRNLSNDWFHPQETYIEVAMSEAQWATFVSSMNVGEGVPCTLLQQGRTSVPQPEAPTRRVEQFTAEMARDLRAAGDALKGLRDLIESLPMTGKARGALLDKVRSAEQTLTSSVPFVAEQFAEHVERTTERAKVEIAAHLQNLMLRAGLQSLQQQEQAKLKEGGDDVDQP